MSLKSDIHLAIWRLFCKHEVKVPFPQCEVTLLNPETAPSRNAP